MPPVIRLSHVPRVVGRDCTRSWTVRASTTSYHLVQARLYLGRLVARLHVFRRDVGMGNFTHGSTSGKRAAIPQVTMGRIPTAAECSTQCSYSECLLTVAVPQRPGLPRVDTSSRLDHGRRSTESVLQIAEIVAVVQVTGEVKVAVPVVE